MKKLILYFIIFPLITPAFCQIQKEWSVIHFPYGNSQNIAYLQKDQLLLNSVGDIIGGWRFTIAGSGYGVGTTSFDMNGNLNWEDAYVTSVSRLNSICVDSQNNVYSLGTVHINSSNEDNVILKYDMSGNNLWTAEDDSVNTKGIDAALVNDKLCVLSRRHPGMYRYNIISGAIIDSIEIDSTDINGRTDLGLIKSDGQNIYYGGNYYTTSIPFIANIYASKTFYGDSILWKTVLDFTSGVDLITDIAFDINGNLYLLANLDASTLTRFVGVCAFDGSTGDTLWTQTIQSTTVESYPSDIVCDNAGHVYVTADVGIDSLQRFQVQLSQFNAATGQLNWSLNFDSLYQEGNRYSKICIDTATKDLFVAYTLRPSTSFIRTAIMRIDSSGSILWSAVFDTLGALEALVYDQQGSLYMAGGVLTKFSLITGINENDNLTDGELHFHYNPITNHIDVSANSLRGNYYRLLILDVSGRIAYSEEGTIVNAFQKAVPFTKQDDGLYFVVLETERERRTGKMVKY